MTFSYLTIRWDRFFLGPSNYWHHVYPQESVLPSPTQCLCCLRMTLRRERPPEVCQAHLKLLLLTWLESHHERWARPSLPCRLRHMGCSKQAIKQWREDEMGIPLPLSQKAPLQPIDKRQSSLHQLPSWAGPLQALSLPLITLGLGPIPKQAHLEV